MNTIIKVKEIRLSRLNNEEYAQFMSNTEKLITTATIEKLKISEPLFGAFKANIIRLTDIARQSRISSETEILIQLDKERDELVVYLMNNIKNERKNPNDSKKKAALELYNLTKNYKGIQYLPYRQETQAIEGLILDLDKSEAKGHLATLGLIEVVEQLKTTNHKYKELTATRAESQTKNIIENAKDVRKEMDKQYDELITRAFVSSVAFPTAETNAFITSINKLIADTQQAYKQRTNTKAQKPKAGEVISPATPQA